LRIKNKGVRRNKVQRRDDKEIWKSAEGERKEVGVFWGIQKYISK
jgi:hypothetical protein